MWLCIGEYNGLKTAHAFLNYCKSKYIRHMEEKTYRAYMSDSAMCLCNIIAGKEVVSERWNDLIVKMRGNNQQDNRTAEDIFNNIKNKCNGGETE